MSVFCTGATVPVRTYKWYKYSATAITEKLISAGSTILYDFYVGTNFSDDEDWTVPKAARVTGTIGSQSAMVTVMGEATSDNPTFTTSDSTTISVSASSNATISLEIYATNISYTTSESGTFRIPNTTTFTINAVLYSTFTQLEDYVTGYGTHSADVYAYISADQPVYEQLTEANYEYTQGDTSYGIVSSKDEGAYPDNGYQDGYWYVRVGA